MIEKMETIKDNPLAAGKPTNRKPRIFFELRASNFQTAPEAMRLGDLEFRREEVEEAHCERLHTIVVV